MAVTKREYILVTFVSSCLAVALLLGAFGTQNWIVGEGETGATRNNLVNYGLFQGTFTSRLTTSDEKKNIYVTCLLGENVCALSCKTDPEARNLEILNILDGNSVAKVCDEDGGPDGNKITKEVVWMNGGMYVTTIFFLSLALLMSVVASLFGLYNVVRSPVEPWMGVFGLYIWNGCSAVFHLTVLIIWGAEFTTNISQNLSFTQIMISDEEDYRSVTARLGFSYWLVFVSMFCSIVNGGMVYFRSYLIRKEPPPPMINIQKHTDDTIFLY